jgi:hypothetical protein
LWYLHKVLRHSEYFQISWRSFLYLRIPFSAHQPDPWFYRSHQVSETTTQSSGNSRLLEEYASLRTEQLSAIGEMEKRRDRLERTSLRQPMHAIPKRTVVIEYSQNISEARTFSVLLKRGEFENLVRLPVKPFHFSKSRKVLNLLKLSHNPLRRVR